MLSNNNMGTAEFTIYDGGTEVGQETVDVSVDSDAGNGGPGVTVLQRCITSLTLHFPFFFSRHRYGVA